MAKKSSEQYLARERSRLLFLGLPFTFKIYKVTPRKLLIENGFLRKEYDETLIYRITDMKMKRGILQRMVGLGTLIVYSKDVSDGGELTIKNIKNCKEFYDQLSYRVEQERLRTGVRPSELIGTGVDGGHGHDFDHDFDGDVDGHFGDF